MKETNTRTVEGPGNSVDEIGPVGLRRHLALSVPLGAIGGAGTAAASFLEGPHTVLAAAIVGMLATYYAVSRWLDEETALAAQSAYRTTALIATVPIAGFAWFSPDLVLPAGLLAFIAFGGYAGSVVVAAPAMCPDPAPRQRATAYAGVLLQTIVIAALVASGTAVAYGVVAVAAFLPLAVHLVAQTMIDGARRDAKERTIHFKRLGRPTID